MMLPTAMNTDYAQTNFGAAKRFRLIIREGGQTREMGGDDVSIAVGIVDNIFMNALETNTSDIHLQPERDQLRIRYRQDGILHSAGELPLEQAQNVLARLKLAAGMRIDEQREPQDGRIDMEYMGRRLSCRASCLPSMNGEKMVMRILDPAAMKVDLGNSECRKTFSSNGSVLFRHLTDSFWLPDRPDQESLQPFTHR
jgi:type II secretory ATPase GspE/PulE/Tfp pilus assembly ATPase PilB-like protein